MEQWEMRKTAPQSRRQPHTKGVVRPRTLSGGRPWRRGRQQPIPTATALRSRRRTQFPKPDGTRIGNCTLPSFRQPTKNSLPGGVHNPAFRKQQPDTSLLQRGTKVAEKQGQETQNQNKTAIQRRTPLGKPDGDRARTGRHVTHHWDGV